MFPKTKKEFLERQRNMLNLGGFLPPGSPPELLFSEGKLHSEKYPSYRSSTRITWYREGKKHGMDADKWGSITYYWKGVLIPERFFLSPKDLSLDEIIRHPNAEVRCVGIEIYGYDRMERENHLKVIDKNKEKEIFLYSFKSPSLHEELRILRLKNSTPEPDGTHKIYYLCVPPNMQKCSVAVAWTFGRNEDEYNPSLET